MSDSSHEKTAGVLLRNARESAGVHLAALAVSLKVPARKLEALEADRFEELPDAVFARALASSVCRTLKIDPQPVLNRLPQTTRPRLAQTQDSINAPFREPGYAPGANWKDYLRRPPVMAVIALLLGAVVLIVMPDLRRDTAAGVSKAESPAGAPMAAPVVLEPSTESAAAASVANTGAEAAGAPVRADSPPAAGATQIAAASVSDAAPQPAAPILASNAVPAAGSAGVLVFRASAPSWIQVIDAKGVVALRKRLEAGESADVSGTPPLAVTVGSARGTAVEVRGKVFDLGPVTRDNVARFEVK